MTESTTTPELPDDPKDCCRRAIDILNHDDFEDRETLVHDLLAVSYNATSSGQVYEPERLASVLNRARDAMEDLRADLNAVRALVRHGTTDCREIDEEYEEIQRARAEGREAPVAVKFMSRVAEAERGQAEN